MSSSQPTDCWFPHTFADGPVHHLSPTEGALLKGIASGELAPPQMLCLCVFSSVLEESDRNVITNAMARLACPQGRMALLPPCLLFCLASLLMYWAWIWMRKATGTWRTSHRLASSICVPACQGTSRTSKKRATKFELVVRLTLGIFFDLRYTA